VDIISEFRYLSRILHDVKSTYYGQVPLSVRHQISAPQTLEVFRLNLCFVSIIRIVSGT